MPEKEKKEEKKKQEKKEKVKVPRLRRRARFKLAKAHIVGILAALAIVLVALLLFFFTDIVDNKMLFFLLGIALVIAGLPFFSTLLFEAKLEENKETMFLEFSRDLVEGVKSGTSIGKSIDNLRGKDYGMLTPYIQKLANQIDLGIPVKDALNNFAKDVRSRVISRAITLIQEAERAGGRIETILESVARSVGQIEKLRKERRAAISNLIVQGYIVFLIFIAIMLVMQFKILPLTTEIGGGGLTLGGGGFELGEGLEGVEEGAARISIEEMATAFLYLLITQGFFAGLVIGKISEGNVKAGLKHSFILVALAIIISQGANVLFAIPA